MQSFFIKLINKLITSVFSQQLKEDNSFSLKKFVVEDNPFQKYGLAAAGGTVVSFISILLMALLIATGEVSLDDMELRKIVDVVMPVRDPELIDSIERPEEAEPEPDQLPPEVDIENIEELLDQSLNPNLNFQEEGLEYLWMGLMCQFFKFLPNIQEELLKEG